MSFAETERAQKELEGRIVEGGFAIALSGGGHRATIATMGALLAIIDRGVGPHIVQVASVSGGSITNAFVAQRCFLDLLKHGELDDVAADLVSTITRKGVLTRPWMLAVLSAPVVLGGSAAVVVGLVITTWLSIVIGVGVGLGLLLARGLAVEWLIERRYFRCHDWVKGETDLHPTLLSLRGRGPDHVFCMTDLVLGLPVYASSAQGMIWRRLRLERDYERRVFQTFRGDHLPIAAIVRASAAFPGIPPRKLRIPSDSQIPDVKQLPRVAFLADGGLWNNLGSQALREDRLTGAYCTEENRVLRPHAVDTSVVDRIPLLCFNAGAPLRPAWPYVFHIPVLAVVRSFLQVANILTINTVQPRLEAMEDMHSPRTTTVPSNLVVDLRPTEELRGRIRDRKGVAIDWHTWDALWQHPAWKELTNKEGEGTVDAPTTLGRIEAASARRLLGRAYVNTYLATIFAKAFDDDDLGKLSAVARRLDKICGLL
jgi:hypothetical protein